MPLHGDALLACLLSPSPSLAMAATAAAAACAGPLCAAGAGKQHRGEIRCHADLSAPPGDFELTSGGCRVRQLEKQAGCAWLLQQVPDLTPLPPLKCSCSFSLPPSPLAASSAIKAQVVPSCKKMPFKSNQEKNFQAVYALVHLHFFTLSQFFPITLFFCCKTQAVSDHLSRIPPAPLPQKFSFKHRLTNNNLMIWLIIYRAPCTSARSLFPLPDKL